MVVTPCEVPVRTYVDSLADAEDGTLFKDRLNGPETVTMSAASTADNEPEALAPKTEVVDEGENIWSVVGVLVLLLELDDPAVDAGASTIMGRHAGAKDIHFFVSGPPEITIPAFSARAA